MNGDTGFKGFRSGGSVRVSLPASVAYDLNAFQKGLGIIAERLGCRTCFSGVDCTFQLARDWLINERLEAHSVVGLPQDPVPLKPVTVNLAKGINYDLAKIQQSVAVIADRLGCGACCSGFDITFREELAFLVDENLNVRSISEIG